MNNITSIFLIEIVRAIYPLERRYRRVASEVCGLHGEQHEETTHLEYAEQGKRGL